MTKERAPVILEIKVEVKTKTGKRKATRFEGTSGVRRVRSFKEIASRRRRRSKLARSGEENGRRFGVTRARKGRKGGIL